jgi:hypothetical protein
VGQGREKSDEDVGGSPVSRDPSHKMYGWVIGIEGVVQPSTELMKEWVERSMADRGIDGKVEIEFLGEIPPKETD